MEQPEAPEYDVEGESEKSGKGLLYPSEKVHFHDILGTEGKKRYDGDTIHEQE